MQADSAQQQGLYRPEFDHDACGIGALADINGDDKSSADVSSGFTLKTNLKSQY